MDGHKQRQALTAAERSLEHLAGGRVEEARRAAARAAELDQVGAFAALPEAVDAVAGDLEGATNIDPANLDTLGEAVGPGPLAALLEPLRSMIA